MSPARSKVAALRLNAALIAWVDARAGEGGRHTAIKTALERYEWLLSKARPLPFTADEAAFIADACRGLAWTPRSLPLLPRHVERELIARDRLTELTGFIAKLRRLTPVQLCAIADALDRYQAADWQDTPMPDRLKAVGLTKG